MESGIVKDVVKCDKTLIFSSKKKNDDLHLLNLEIEWSITRAGQ